jgi:hypothetical protein
MVVGCPPCISSVCSQRLTPPPGNTGELETVELERKGGGRRLRNNGKYGPDPPMYRDAWRAPWIHLSAVSGCSGCMKGPLALVAGCSGCIKGPLALVAGCRLVQNELGTVKRRAQ